MSEDKAIKAKDTSNLVPMFFTFEQFKRLKKEAQSAYIVFLCERYDIPLSVIAENVFEVTEATLKKHLRSNFLINDCNLGVARNRSGMLNFLSDLSKSRSLHKEKDEKMQEPINQEKDESKSPDNGGNPAESAPVTVNDQAVAKNTEKVSAEDNASKADNREENNKQVEELGSKPDGNDKKEPAAQSDKYAVIAYIPEFITEKEFQELPREHGILYVNRLTAKYRVGRGIISKELFRQNKNYLYNYAKEAQLSFDNSISPSTTESSDNKEKFVKAIDAFYQGKRETKSTENITEETSSEYEELIPSPVKDIREIGFISWNQFIHFGREDQIKYLNMIKRTFEVRDEDISSILFQQSERRLSSYINGNHFESAIYQSPLNVVQIGKNKAPFSHIVNRYRKTGKMPSVKWILADDDVKKIEQEEQPSSVNETNTDNANTSTVEEETTVTEAESKKDVEEAVVKALEILAENEDAETPGNSMHIRSAVLKMDFDGYDGIPLQEIKQITNMIHQRFRFSVTIKEYCTKSKFNAMKNSALSGVAENGNELLTALSDMNDYFKGANVEVQMEIEISESGF